MVYEVRKQLITWMEMDYSKDTHFQWKIKWQLEHLGALRIMGEMAPLSRYSPPPPPPPPPSLSLSLKQDSQPQYSLSWKLNVSQAGYCVNCCVSDHCLLSLLNSGVWSNYGSWLKFSQSTRKSASGRTFLRRLRMLRYSKADFWACMYLYWSCVCCSRRQHQLIFQQKLAIWQENKSGQWHMTLCCLSY